MDVVVGSEAISLTDTPTVALIDLVAASEAVRLATVVARGLNPIMLTVQETLRLADGPQREAAEVSFESAKNYIGLTWMEVSLRS